MSFLRTSFWGGLSTGITMIAGLITTKYVAVIIGTEGMAYAGQFSNVTVVITLLATGACATGVVKYISEFQDQQKRQDLFSNAILLASGCTLVVSLLVLLFSGTLSNHAFKSGEFSSVFLIYGLLLFFPTFNTLASALFNGLQQIRLMSIMNMGVAIINVISVILGAKWFGIQGVLLANVVSAFFAFFVYWYMIRRRQLLVADIRTAYRPEYFKLLLGYSAMSIVSGLVAPSLQLFVRTKLLHNFDANAAGIWQANTRLSDYYLNFVYTVIGIYYLPKLSELTNRQKLKREVWLGYARILPAVIIVTLIIWFCRHFIIDVLLTKQFADMLLLLKWQLIGDVVKIASWILGYLMVAKAMKRAFIGTEIVFSTTYVLLNYWFINQFGLVGTVYAFTLNYFLYLLTLLVVLRRIIF